MIDFEPAPFRGAFTGKPEVTLQFRPACAGCGAVHPLTAGHPGDVCHVCGAPAAQPGPGITVEALVAGKSIGARVARACFWAAEQLGRWARKVDR